MDKKIRNAVIAGNWKMNMTPSATKEFMKELAAKTKGKDACKIVLCVPAIDIPAAVESTKGTNITVGAENVHFEKSGAFTGEISSEMLCDAGAEYVIVGHSERRQYFAETDETVNLRAKAAIASGLMTIICVGENLHEREVGVTDDIIAKQTKIALSGIEKSDLSKIIIAYEPVWAIGTGKTATALQAEEVCKNIRDVVCALYDKDTAEKMSILYGGSMNDKNAAELLSMKDIDGGLIGGASLVADKFTAIIDAACNG